MFAIILIGFIGFFVLGTVIKKHEKQEMKRLRKTVFSMYL